MTSPWLSQQQEVNVNRKAKDLPGKYIRILGEQGHSVNQVRKGWSERQKEKTAEERE